MIFNKQKTADIYNATGFISHCVIYNLVQAPPTIDYSVIWQYRRTHVKIGGCAKNDGGKMQMLVQQLILSFKKVEDCCPKREVDNTLNKRITQAE